MSKRYRFDIFEGDELQLFYPREMQLKQEIKRVAFGASVTEAAIRRHPNGRNVIAISSALAEKLLVPEFIHSLYLFEEDDVLHAGPLVGIFTSGFTPFQMMPAGARSASFARLLSVQSSVGAVPFLFGEQHIDWEQGVIHGFFHHHKGWVKKAVPFPNVIYDRLPNRQAEREPAAKKVKETLEKDYLIPWYNPGFFNKLAVYEKLCSDARAEPHLPETLPFLSFSDMERMLEEYGHIYLKHPDGSRGNGIRQILLDAKNRDYYCRYFDGKTKLLKFSSLESLLKHVYTGKQLESAVVQQGIHLIRKDKKPVDFRLHAHKDENGKWVVAAIAAKAAGSGSPTTHEGNGGKVYTMEEMFSDEDERREISRKLEQTAIELASAIEDNIGGIIGEIGFDLGLDKQGKVWMFEANSKPGRGIFTHPGLRESDLLTRRLALSFAVHLTEKTIREPHLLFR